MELRYFSSLSVLLLAVVGVTGEVRAQELEPRAYVTLPTGLNLLGFGYSRAWGEISFEPTAPVRDVSAGINGTALAYTHAFDFLGRSASVSAVLPYVWGEVSGFLDNEFASARRSGLADTRFRFAFNLYGGPALAPKDFASYQQKTNIGLSFVVVPPTGQYDPTKLINIGGNRWAFKSEVGLSHAFQKFHFDVYLGGWFFTDNDNYLQGSARSQDMVGSLQFHLSYNFNPRLWIGFDSTFFTGGRVDIDGEESSGLQRSSRLGLTVSVPVTRRSSFKVAFNTGAFTRLAADFNRVSIGYHFLWFSNR